MANIVRNEVQIFPDWKRRREPAFEHRMAILRSLMPHEAVYSDTVDFNLVLRPPQDVKDIYAWREKNWGTSSNASNSEVGFLPDTLRLRFETKWAAPLGVIEELSRLFPEAVVAVCWASDDLGRNVGSQEYRDGEFVSEEDLSLRDEQELAFSMWDIDPERDGYVLSENGERWVYLGDEEYTLADFLGTRVLYLQEKTLTGSDTPQGLHRYYVDIDNILVRERPAPERMWATILSREELPLPDKGELGITDENAPRPCGEATLGEYLAAGEELTPPPQRGASL